MAQSREWEQLIKSLPLQNKPTTLKIGREISRGAWGIVYDGVLDRRPVAVKALHLLLTEGEDGGEVVVRKFCEECDRLKELEHCHVIRFLGAYKDAKLGPILVMEKMKEHLLQFLERSRDKLAVHEQLHISLQITQGVAFLHKLKPPIVHRDLNHKNVMISFDGVTKIGDFGQSKLKQNLYLTTTQPGMIPFMPPEALCGNSKYDESLDVFSLGVLMLEIGTQQQPISNLQGIGVTLEVERRKDDLGRMSHLHPLKPSILCCLRDDPELRPKASALEIVLPMLKVNLEEVQQELTELKEAKQELEEVQQEYARAQQELCRTQQELEEANSEVQKLTDSLSAEKEKCIVAHHANQKNLKAVRQLTGHLSQTEELMKALHAKEKEYEATAQQRLRQLIKAQSNAQKLSNELSTATERIQTLQAEQQQIKVDCARDTERELASSRQRLKAKDAELCGAQQQLAELQAELKQLAHKKELCMCEGDIKDCTGADVPHEPKAKRDIKDCTAADVPREPKTEGDIKDCTAADVSREPKAEGDIKDCTAANVLREPKAERDKIQDGRASSRRRGRSGDEVGPWTEKLKRHLDCLQEQNEQGTIQVEMIDQFKAEVDGLRKAMQLQLRGPQARPRHPDNPEDSQVPPVFERIETKGAQCHSNVKNQLHDLQVILDDEAASAPRSKPLRDQARQSSGTYQSVDLGIRIILCKVLQDCYNRCVSHLIEESTEAVVLFQSDASQFTQEVIGCMNHAFHLKLSCGKGKDSHSDHLSSDQVAQQARKLMLTVTTPKRELPDTDMKKYAAVYALAMSYLDGRRGSDVQEGILIEMELMNYPNWKSFVNKVVPICWELATIYMPPIFMCATKDQMVFDDVCHERHPKSAVSHIIQSYIFPLVYRDHRGEICKKAVVLTKFLDRREMY